MTSNPFYIEDDNLSRAWARAFFKTLERGTHEVTPLVVTVTGFDDSQPCESYPVAQLLDEALLGRGDYSIRSTANTIFPRSQWNPMLGRAYLYERYLHILPRIRRMDTHNKYDLYFDRLINFGSEHYNQIEHIITTYQGGNHRRSALQAAIFDPRTDHTDQRQRGFPCLQQVAFIPHPQEGGLTITGFYATQYIFERAYGNYRGLCDLGHFVAQEMNLRLTCMTCVAAVAQYGTEGKRELSALARKIERVL